MTPEEQALQDAKNAELEAQKKAEEEAWKKSSTGDVKPEDYNKLLEEKNNLNIALKQEREEAKALKEFKQSVEAKEKEAEEKKQIEKGKAEEIISSLKKENEELKAKATAYDELNAKITTEKTQEVDTILSWLPEDLVAKYKPIADKLELDDRLTFFKWIVADLWSTAWNKDFNWKPAESGGAKPNDIDIIAEKIAKWQKVSPTERATYMSSLASLSKKA